MIKKAILLLSTSLIIFAGDFSLDTNKSEVYYEAKKDQFFSTYTILATNKGISGTLMKLPKGYRGTLNIDVFSFDSDNTRRDSNVEDYLNAQTYGLINYEFELYKNKATGIMTINGVSKEINFPVKMDKKGEELFVEGNVTIRYNDFNIDTPSNIILSAHDTLIIGAKLYFHK